MLNVWIETAAIFFLATISLASTSISSSQLDSSLLSIAKEPPSQQEQQGSRQRKAVANGDDVTDPSRYPYFARIDFDGSQACGGSLIHPEFVLSAAHCFLYLDEEVTVFLGVLDVEDYTRQARVRKITNHPAYDDVTLFNDVALIHVDPVDFAEPIKFNMDRKVLQPGDSVTVVGFGKMETQEFADTLQEVELKVTSDGQCDVEHQMAGGIVGMSMLCALDAPLRQDACVADSGGPLMVLGDGPDQDLQVGVVSSGIGECGQAESSGVYSEVAYFSEWINTFICENADNPPKNCTTTANSEVEALIIDRDAGDVCQDFSGAFYIDWWTGFQRCDWVREETREYIYCTRDHEAWFQCPFTCHACTYDDEEYEEIPTFSESSKQTLPILMFVFAGLFLLAVCGWMGGWGYLSRCCCRSCCNRNEEGKELIEGDGAADSNRSESSCNLEELEGFHNRRRVHQEKR